VYGRQRRSRPASTLGSTLLAGDAPEHAMMSRSAALPPPGAHVNENFSLIAMVVAMLLSLAFLAQQVLTYH